MPCCSDTSSSQKSILANTERSLKQNNTYKVIVVGEAAVGKTTLSLRMNGIPFRAQRQETLGVDFLNRSIHVKESNGDEYDAKMMIWDTAGQERFRTMIASYYRNANGIIFVFDVTDEHSFDRLCNYWVPEAQKYSGAQQFLLVGNKVDLLSDAAINDLGFDPPERLEKMMENGNWKYIKTSATYDNQTLQEIFDNFFLGLIAANRPQESQTL